MNLHNVNTILTHEAKIQGRGILFKILAGLVIGGITYIVMIYHGNFPSASWQRIAISSYIPWVSTTLLNLLQNLFVIFTISGFYKRSTAENLEVHPAGNSEWLLGKTLGVIKVLFILDLASIGITSTVHVLLTDSPFNIGIYLFYFITLTVPATLFYSGLTLFLSFLTRHKGITILVTGLLYLCTSGFFHDYWNGTTDVLAISIPNIFSNITEPGEYEIFAHIPLIYTVQPPVLNNYCNGAILHYTIEQEKKQEVKLDLMNKRERRLGFWVPLGTFTLVTGKTSVTLDDRGSSSQYIVADAIKWVKKKPSTNK